MSEIIKITLSGLFFGTFGTTIGGILGIVIKNNSNKFISFILSLASGLMMSIVCFELIPEAMNLSELAIVIFGILLGILCMISCDKLVEIKFKNTFEKKVSLMKTGIIVSVGLAIHNFPEGLAIGSGFGESTKLGLTLALAICLHDIPEGISMAIPMKNGGIKKHKVIIAVIISGITTGLGALVGGIIGGISKEVISICLSFAARSNVIYCISENCYQKLMIFIREG